MNFRVKAIAAALGAMGIFSAGQVSAAGFALIEQNASGLGNSYAGQAAAAENASTVYFNPAGMTLLPGRQASVALHGIRPSAEFSDNGLSRSPANQPIPAGGGNGGDAGGWAVVPNGYVSWQISPNLWAGLGVTVPFGLTTDYDGNFIGRFQSKKAELQTIDVNPSIAYKVNDMVSLGAGFSYQKADLTLERSFFVGAERFQQIELDDDAWGWNIGAMITFSPATRVGISYRSQMEYDLEGSVVVYGLAGTSGRAEVEFPASFSVAVSHQATPAVQVLADFTWTEWSSIKNVPLVLTATSALGPAGRVGDILDFEFRNTYRVGLGANYKWNDNFTLKVGTAYDKTPVPDALHRTVFLPDNDRWWLSIGGKYKVSNAGTIDFGYAHLFISDADTFRSKGVGAAGAQGIVSGTYEADVNIISAQYTHNF